MADAHHLGIQKPNQKTSFRPLWCWPKENGITAKSMLAGLT